MTTHNFCFYLQNRLIQTRQTGGQQYSDTSPFSFPWLDTLQGTGPDHYTASQKKSNSNYQENKPLRVSVTNPITKDKQKDF